MERGESPYVLGEQVVADDAPVFRPIGSDDVKVIQVLQIGAVPGFAVAPVRRAFRLDHVGWHAQGHSTVDLSPAVGEPVVTVLDDDLVTEVPRRPGAGVRDQGFVWVEIQSEFVAQEPRQLIFYGLGFGFRSDESEQVIVGLCRGPGYADVGAGSAGQTVAGFPSSA